MLSFLSLKVGLRDMCKEAATTKAAGESGVPDAWCNHRGDRGNNNKLHIHTAALAWEIYLISYLFIYLQIQSNKCNILWPVKEEFIRWNHAFFNELEFASSFFFFNFLFFEVWTITMYIQ